MIPENINKNSTPLKIVNEIIRNLENGKFKPGDKLPSERELCKIYDVGRSSVREAIRILVVMGYLESFQGRGTFITMPPDMIDMPLDEMDKSILEAPIVDLMEAREILEISMTKLAAERADNDIISKLNLLLEKMKESKDGDDFLDYDLEFHILIAEASNNVILNEMMKSLMNELNKYKSYFSAGSPWTKNATIQTTSKIIEYISLGQGDMAAEKMHEHLSLVSTNWKKMRS